MPTLNSDSDEQRRITQLIGDYSPAQPPTQRLDLGDYLSIVWRLDRSVGQAGRDAYYRRCLRSLAEGLQAEQSPLARLIDATATGAIYNHLPNLVYRIGTPGVDAADRCAALRQLLDLRADILRMGAYSQTWGSAYPGSGIVNPDLRDRVFAVLFTAFQSQYAHFGRMLLVIDIVIDNLLFGFRDHGAVTLDA